MAKRRLELYGFGCLLSSQAACAEGLRSINLSIPATKTPSSLSSARLSISQLRLLIRRSERQALSRVRHSFASADVGAVTKRTSMKLEAIVKFVRASGNRQHAYAYAQKSMISTHSLPRMPPADARSDRLGTRRSLSLL